MTMGEEYCRHCEGETQGIMVNERWLSMLLWHLSRDALLKCQDMLAEEILSHSEHCEAVRSRRVCQLVREVLLLRFGSAWWPVWHVRY
jgi:hypothetical protein